MARSSSAFGNQNVRIWCLTDCSYCLWLWNNTVLINCLDHPTETIFWACFTSIDQGLKSANIASDRSGRVRHRIAFLTRKHIFLTCQMEVRYWILLVHYKGRVARCHFRHDEGCKFWWNRLSHISREALKWHTSIASSTFCISWVGLLVNHRCRMITKASE